MKRRRFVLMSCMAENLRRPSLAKRTQARGSIQNSLPLPRYSSSMALLLGGIQPQILTSFRHDHRESYIRVCRKRFHYPVNTRIRSVLSSPFNRKRIFVRPPKSASIDGFSVQNKAEALSEEKDEDGEFLKRLRRWFSFLPWILPGGSWWNFSENVEIQDSAKPVTVRRALAKMWQLVAQDRWIIFCAFCALILEAVSEISIPHFLTATIFSAQGADVPVFGRNVYLLVLFCITSGICRSKSLGYEAAVLDLQI